MSSGLSKINFHPHVHAIVSRGGWTKGGVWIPVAYVDTKPAELLFRHKVFSLLGKAGVIEEDRIALLLWWKHSGFSIHNSVTVEPEDPLAVERLVRYLMRPPVSLERVVLDPESGEVSLQPKAGADDGAGGEEVERIDPDELVARVTRADPRSEETPDPQLWKVRQRDEGEAGGGRGGRGRIPDRSRRRRGDRGSHDGIGRERARHR